MEADWSNLNKDLVQAIGEKLDSYGDYLRFRLVSIEWTSSLAKNPRCLQQQLVPYLLLPRLEEVDDEEEEEEEEDKEYDPNLPSHRPLLNVLDGKIVDYLELPETAPNGGRGDKLHFRGFSKGWLIAFEEEGIALHLINTFPGHDRHRLLPPITTLPDVIEYRPDQVGAEFVLFRRSEENRVTTYSEMLTFFIKKVVLSSPPTSSHCISLALYGEGYDLAYCRYGDDRWRKFGGKALEMGGIADAISYNDKFYVIDFSGRVVLISVSNLDCVAVEIVKHPITNILGKQYLALVRSSHENHDHLLIIGRSVNVEMLKSKEGKAGSDEEFDVDADLFYETNYFDILLKLNLSNNQVVNLPKKNLRRSLDDFVLFLGFNESFSFPSSNFSDCKGKGRIYFSDDNYEGHNEQFPLRGSDMGVCQFNNGNFKGQTYPPLRTYQYFQLLWPSPIWIMRHNP